MNTRRVCTLFVCLVAVLAACGAQPAQAAAIGFSSITANNLTMTAVGGTLTFDPFVTEAFAQGQNSLGELDQQFDSQIDAASTANASATWIGAHATADGSQSSASVDINLPDQDAKAAKAVAQALWFTTFTLTGDAPFVPITLAVDVSGAFQMATDSTGGLASEVICQVLLDGDTILFSDRLRSIGADATLDEPFFETLTTSLSLESGTHSFYLQVDSEYKDPPVVPEPSTVTLTLFGLIGIWRARARVQGRVRPAARQLF